MANSSKYSFFQDEEPIAEILQELQVQPAQVPIPVQEQVNLQDIAFLAELMDEEARNQLFPGM
jgi:hypothetical protein